MGLGSTAKKVQKLADVAEKTYSRINDLRDQLQELRGTVEDTSDRVERLEREVAAQRAVLDAVAEEQGLDPETLAADAETPDQPSSSVDRGDRSVDGRNPSTD